MLQSIRSVFQSKLGIALTLAFVGLIALAFASGDVANSGGFGSIAGGDKLASVGSESLTATEVENAAADYLSRLRQRDPTASMAAFLSSGGFEEMLTYLIDRRAVRLFGEKNGIHIGDRLIDSEIVKIPQIQGPDGKVDPALYRQYLAQRGQTDAEFRRELTEDLMARQLMGSNAVGLRVPVKVTTRYAGMITERRKGFIVTLPAAAFAPTTPPSEAEIANWYSTRKGDYALPERRTIRYFSFGDNMVKDVPVPAEAEIAARYTASKAKYAPTDKRKLSQIVLPTEAAAKAVASEVAGGKSLEASALSKGLAVAPLGTLTKDEYALQSSSQTADAVFAAPTGKVIGPFKAPLGWLLIRVDANEATPGKTLDQARPELVKELTEENRRAKIAEFSAKIEDDLANGANLTDLARDMGAQVIETPLLTANGEVYGKPGVAAPAPVLPLLKAAFAMESERQPQLAEIDPGKTFMIYDVGTLTPAAPPPLAEIRSQVIADIQQSKGAKAAKAAADKVEAQLKKGVPIEVAVASLGVSLPPIDRVDKARMEVQSQGKNASKPEVLLFAMTKGTVRLMAAPRNRGWYVVSVTEVTPGTVAKDDKRLPGFQESLQSDMGAEYSTQLGAAMRKDVGSSRNDGNVEKVRKRLGGAQ